MKKELTSSSAAPAKSRHREKIAIRYAKRDEAFHALVEGDNLRIHACTTLTAKAGPFLDSIYFVGVNSICCKQGSYRLTFDDHDPITLSANECLTVFPGHIVAFEALDTSCPNILTYSVLAGSFAEEFVSSLGYYDFLKVRCPYPTATLQRIQSILENKDMTKTGPRKELVGIFESMMLTVLELAKLDGDAFFFDAIRVVNRNVSQGKCRIGEVCKELGIGRTQLHRLFAHAGLGSAGAYVKSLQFRFAMKLLRVSRLSIAEIAYRVGFASSTQFSAFIRQRSGKPPIAHRGKA